MKTFWSLLAKILLVIVIVEAWFLYDYYHKNQQLIAENVQLEIELLQSKEALIAAEDKAAELEKRSLEGLLKETNKAVVSGWEKLLDAVEDELNKARESIEELNEEESNQLNGPEEPQTQKQSPENEAQSQETIPQEPIKGERT